MKKYLFKIIMLFNRVFSYIYREAYFYSALSNGLKVGRSTKFIGKQCFGSEPYLITIGDDSLITDGVKFITHDGAIQVPLIQAGKSFYDVYSQFSIFGKINIGNNVFVGDNTIILKGTNISNNCIIGAGSIVKGDFPENSVIAGVPAKVISTVDAYFEKNSEGLLKMPKGVDRKSYILINTEK